MPFSTVAVLPELMVTAPPIDIAPITFRAPLASVMLPETVSGLLTLIVPPQELSITRSAIVKLASTSAVFLVLPLVKSAVSEVPGTAPSDQLFGLLQLLSAAPVQMSVDSKVRDFLKRGAFRGVACGQFL